MSFSAKQMEQLRAELNGARIKTRKIDGRDEKYLEAWDVIRQANDVFGPDGWSSFIEACELVPGTPLKLEKKDQNGKPYEVWYTAYRAQVRVIAVAGPEHADTAVGDSYVKIANPPDHDLAAKSAVSQATKRALRKFGPTFGLFLADDADPYGAEYAAWAREQATRPAETQTGGSPAREPVPHQDPRPVPRPSAPARSAPGDIPGIETWPEGVTRGDLEGQTSKAIQDFRRAHGMKPRAADKLAGPNDLKAMEDKALLDIAFAVEHEASKRRRAA